MTCKIQLIFPRRHRATEFYTEILPCGQREITECLGDITDLSEWLCELYTQ